MFSHPMNFLPHFLLVSSLAAAAASILWTTRHDIAHLFRNL